MNSQVLGGEVRDWGGGGGGGERGTGGGGEGLGEGARDWGRGQGTWWGDLSTTRATQRQLSLETAHR